MADEPTDDFPDGDDPDVLALVDTEPVELVDDDEPYDETAAAAHFGDDEDSHDHGDEMDGVVLTDDDGEL